MLISDRWDVWKIPVAAGAPAVNLTVNGRKDQIRYQGRVRIDPDERGIDLGKPQYFAAMSEWTKRAGYAVLQPGQAGMKMVLWEDAVDRPAPESGETRTSGSTAARRRRRRRRCT